MVRVYKNNTAYIVCEVKIFKMAYPTVLQTV